MFNISGGHITFILVVTASQEGKWFQKIDSADAVIEYVAKSKKEKRKVLRIFRLDEFGNTTELTISYQDGEFKLVRTELIEALNQSDSTEENK